MLDYCIVVRIDIAVVIDIVEPAVFGIGAKVVEMQSELQLNGGFELVVLLAAFRAEIRQIIGVHKVVVNMIMMRIAVGVAFGGKLNGFLRFADAAGSDGASRLGAGGLKRYLHI